jgi:hypothetical protein
MRLLGTERCRGSESLHMPSVLQLANMLIP